MADIGSVSRYGQWPRRAQMCLLDLVIAHSLSRLSQQLVQDESHVDHGGTLRT